MAEAPAPEPVRDEPRRPVPRRSRRPKPPHGPTRSDAVPTPVVVAAVIVLLAILLVLLIAT